MCDTGNNMLNTAVQEYYDELCKVQSISKMYTRKTSSIFCILDYIIFCLYLYIVIVVPLTALTSKIAK